MRNAIALVTLALSIGACSAPAPVAQTSAASLRCIPLNQVAGRRVEGNGVAFEMLDGAVYHNGLGGHCPGVERLGSLAAISVVSGGEGGQLCAGDRIRVADPVEARATGLASYPVCLLGDFTRTSESRR